MKAEHTIAGLAGLVAALLASLPCRAEDVSAQMWADAIEQTFADLHSDTAPGCVAGVAAGGEVIASGAYGLANLEHSVPNTESTVFRIGSVSKQFTAASIALLVLEDSLALDADVRSILPDLPDLASEITVRHLISHSSGLPDVYSGLAQTLGDEDGNFYPSEFVLHAIRRTRQLEFPPGERFEYSNEGYLLLAQVVEAISGKTLATFADENIFQPLSMVDTHFHDDYRVIVPNRAHGYGKNASGEWEIRNSNFHVVGDGGVFTTLADFARWEGNFFDNVLGSDNNAFTEMMETPRVYVDEEAQLGGRNIDYAFGLIIWQHSGRRAIGHRGSWAGYRAAAVRFPEEKVSIMAFCNFNEADSLVRVFEVADAVFGQAPQRSNEQYIGTTE